MEKDMKRIKVATKTRDIVFTGLLIALVFVATNTIRVTNPMSTANVIHAGEFMLFVTAIVFGKKKGAIAGAFGMGIFDILSGYAVWAPFTFVIRGVMGYMVGSITHSKDNDGDNIPLNIFATILSGVIMIGGYYIAEGIIYGNWIYPVKAIPGNLVQLAVGIVLGIPSAVLIKRVAKKANLI